MNRVKELLRNRLTKEQRILPRLLLNTVSRPLDYKRNYNWLQYYLGLWSEEINYVPPVFIATITMLCNLRCPTCLYIIKDQNAFDNKYCIDVDKLTEVLDKYGSRMSNIWLSGGEPLVHPRFDTIVKMCKGFNLTISVGTNGVLLPKNIDTFEMVDYTTISVDAVNAEGYRIARGGTEKEFNSIIAGIKMLRSRGNNFGISFLLSKSNISQIHRMLDFASKLQVKIVSFHNINPHGDTERFKPLMKTDSETMKILDGVISRNDYPFDIDLPAIFRPGTDEFKKAVCIQPWYYLCFDERGDVAYCCHLRHSGSIGNVFGECDFNSSSVVNFRRKMLQGDYPQDCLYCHRRFMGKETRFDSVTKRWYVNW